ncbi:MAG TPA: pyruvate formate-lyase [Candidatus Gallacutalibacter stercoravium]|nr:pyruvate formate-lyase [Candidatus Gallacutalibacter stercoravium]
MNPRIEEMRDFFIVKKGHHARRQPPVDPYCLAVDFQKNNTSDIQRAVQRLLFVLQQEQPVIFAGERIALTRTVPVIPELFTEDEMDALKAKYWIHEKGDVCNINVDYARLINCGFTKKKEEIRQRIAAFSAQGDNSSVEYLQVLLQVMAGIEDSAERYRREAEAQGNQTVAQSFSNIPANPPRNLTEAMQFFRLLHFCMWCGRNYHNTVGRLDQYLFPYLKQDLDNGVLDETSALELVEEFFLTFNRDSDLYCGMQQGDNGQSLVLGGRDQNGRDCYNLLSELCLKASLELRLIDPKINLRVHSKTPLSTYILGTELTKQGLGFPQYSNDDVVIPGLIRLGYREEDAYNYVVAACWEFIIPGCAMDVPNIGALSFAEVVDDAVLNTLPQCENFDQLLQAVKQEIYRQADALCSQTKNLYIFPAPLLSLMMEGCVEQARDVSLGQRYNNYGLHGTGLATAADSLAAVKKYVFDEKEVDAATLVQALRNDFEGQQELCNKLRFEAPKMGNNDDAVDNLACWLLEQFAQSLQGRHNDRGGIYRPGTGSAMYYLWHAKDIPATPDGRRKGEALPANYSPSLFSRCKGPVSILRSFAKPDLSKTINGGPLTLELHDTVFRTPDSIRKVAMLVKSFMDMGGHQLQLNAVNKETMLDAQRHPENYRNLIVRVWGWSGYFVELDKEYQDHIIQRMELSV